MTDHTHEMSDAPEAATSEASEPKSLTREMENNTMMTGTDDVAKTPGSWRDYAPQLTDAQFEQLEEDERTGHLDEGVRLAIAAACARSNAVDCERAAAQSDGDEAVPVDGGPIRNGAVIDLTPRRQSHGAGWWIAETFRSRMFPEDYVTVSVEHWPATSLFPERRGVRIVANDDVEPVDEYDEPVDPAVVVLDWDTARRLADHIIASTAGNAENQAVES